MTRNANDHVILVVEDSDVDYETTRRALRAAGIEKGLRRCLDGESVLDYLYRRGEYSDPKDAPRPYLILMDLNLPGTDGRQVIEEIKNDAKLRWIPIVVLSTSSYPKDIEETYRAGVNAYIHKSIELENFFSTIKVFKEFWLQTAWLPMEEAGP